MADIVKEITDSLILLGDNKIATHSQRFFKTGKGEYGEGDVFLGIRVPVLRKVAKKYISISLADTKQLLQSKFHEIRLFALILLGEKYQRAQQEQQREIYTLYLGNTNKINNWDLVDASAYKIVGPFLHNRDKGKLYELARSKNIWERRIAIIATLYFIRHGQFEEVIRIAEMLLSDKQDLIHKAVGWMLREMGKRSLPELESFLNKHYSVMPRTMLRYAIEKLPDNQRKLYLRGKM